MKEFIFYHILEMSLEASFIILIVLAARICLKEKPKIFSYMLWGVVFFRLLCPIALELPVSFVPKDVGSGLVMKEIADTYVGEQRIHWNYTEEFDSALKQGAEPVIQKDENGEILDAYVVTGENGVSKPSVVYEVVLPLLCNLWMIGIAGLVFYSLITYVKLKKKLIGAVPLDEEQDIYLSDYIETAFVIGFLYPKIYLPSTLSKNEQNYIFLHEKQHTRRKDHWMKMISFIALCMHWFNPLVWIAFFEMTKDMEMSCDEAVLKSLGNDIREEYAVSLLGLATGRRIVAATPLAFGEGNTAARIENAIKWKRSSVKTLIVTGVLCVLVGTVSLANAENDIIVHPYEWTSTVTVDEIRGCKIISWKDEAMEFFVTNDQCADLVYVLNGLSKFEITKEIPQNKKEMSILITNEAQEILLTYGDGITTFSFTNENELRLDQKVWQTDADQMTICMRNLKSQGIRTYTSEGGVIEKTLPPTKEEVLARRKKALEGMSQKEIDRLTELIQVENQSREWKFIYGVLDIVEVKTPKAEEFYKKIDTYRSLIKSDFLKADFDRLEECMSLAVETHDVNYLYEIYYIFHDLDYYLLRYGPIDVGAITDDDSTVRKYYGALGVYKESLPSVTAMHVKNANANWDSYLQSNFECILRTYYQMSDGSFRIELTSNKNGGTTEVYSYPYCMVFEGIHPTSREKVRGTVLSQTEKLSFERIDWEKKRIFGCEESEAILVSIQLIKE